ncbi:hypothetical protein F2P81_012507 [Scophthalmus maximus]|uniref:Uncharacterized protein n=1 Tax=Scophthalmus maximus TaxID=52904 RepID=A0A6A4SPT8_SCOMX|nr:hypothetical protein F2P81_012507 [Scophthalmus maximus]
MKTNSSLPVTLKVRHQLRGGAGSRLITLTETRHKVLTCRTSDGPRPPPGSAGPSSTPRHRQQPTQHLLTFGNFGEPRRTLEEQVDESENIRWSISGDAADSSITFITLMKSRNVNVLFKIRCSFNTAQLQQQITVVEPTGGEHVELLLQ